MERENRLEEQKHDKKFRQSPVLETYVRKNRKQLLAIKHEFAQLGISGKEVARILSLPESLIKSIDQVNDQRQEEQ